MQRVKGFTLVELMITILILAILLGFAVPSFQAMMRNNAVVAASNQLLGALLLARSEAVKREAPVTVTFPATADGWVVTDAAGNVLLTHAVSNAAIVVTPTGNAGGGIIFGSDGRSSVRYQSDDYLKISYQESKRQICLSASGRPWIESGGSCS